MLISLLVIAITTTGCRPYQKTPLAGRLTILSEPTDGADIFINKRKQAFKTNAWFNLKPGFYKIALVKEDKIGEAVVTVKAGRSSRLTTLPASSGREKLGQPVENYFIFF